MEYITLSNGVKMPQIGYGVYQVTRDECERCVSDALAVGYRLIDTAQSYFNEEQVGAAIEASGVDRNEIFLTTKVWIEHYGYEETKNPFRNQCASFGVIILICAFFTSPFPITTVRGAHLRSFMRRERSVR